jgi:hypothetical protein
MRWLITNFKKEYLYGDCHLETDGYWFPLIGVRLKIKILNLFWINYKQFYYVGRV